MADVAVATHSTDDDNPETMEDPPVEDGSAKSGSQAEALVDPTPKGTEKPNEDLTMNGMTIEIIKGFIKQAEADIKRIKQLMGPIIQSMIKAGNVAWRHIHALITSIQDRYNESNSDATA